MKKLIFIGGPAGCGKSTVCKLLAQRLPNCVFYDGDWVWEDRVYLNVPETYDMIFGKVSRTLNEYLCDPRYENIVFCWLLQKERLIQRVLAPLKLDGCEFFCFTLMCERDELVRRVQADIQAGLRLQNAVAESMKRYPLFDALDTEKIDVTHITPDEAAQRILRLST